MDEPLGALDRNLREHMKSEIMRIQQELDITVIFVTHDQDEALTMSDRIAVINEGRLVQVADSEGLYNRPANRFVASFVGESNMFPCRVDEAGDGLARVTIADATRGQARLSGQAKGDPGWLFVRPEHIDIDAPAAATGGRNTLSGEVETALFLGEMSRYTVRCGPVSVAVKRQNQGRNRFPAGSAVTLTWDPENCVVLD